MGTGEGTSVKGGRPLSTAEIAFRFKTLAIDILGSRKLGWIATGLAVIPVFSWVLGFFLPHTAHAAEVGFHGGHSAGNDGDIDAARATLTVTTEDSVVSLNARADTHDNSLNGVSISGKGSKTIDTALGELDITASGKAHVDLKGTVDTSVSAAISHDHLDLHVERDLAHEKTSMSLDLHQSIDTSDTGKLTGHIGADFSTTPDNNESRVDAGISYTEKNGNVETSVGVEGTYDPEDKDGGVMVRGKVKW